MAKEDYMVLYFIHAKKNSFKNHFPHDVPFVGLKFQTSFLKRKKLKTKLIHCLGNLAKFLYVFLPSEFRSNFEDMKYT